MGIISGEQSEGKDRGLSTGMRGSSDGEDEDSSKGHHGAEDGNGTSRTA